MKRVRINIGKVGLVFRYGDFKRVITEGVHWIGLFDEVKLHDQTQPFYSTINLNILLRNTELASMLEVVEVKESQIALQFEKDVFKGVLTAGSYAFWKGVIDHRFQLIDLSNYEIAADVDKDILTKPEVLRYVRVFVVESFEKGLMFVNGKFKKELSAGVYYFWKNTDAISVQKVDLRLQQMEIPGQEILTKDKAALRVNFNVKFKVKDATKALVENKDFEKQLYVAVQMALREFVGGLDLDELLERKESVSDFVLKEMKARAVVLGIEITDCGIKDIILPGEVKDIMNRVLIAQKQAQANIITRREETASTRSLLNTAKLMEDNEMLYKLKEMEYVEKIADKINSISVSGGGQVVNQLKEIFT